MIRSQCWHIRAADHRGYARSVVALVVLAGAPLAALAEMVHSDLIGNDPKKVQLCIERSKIKRSEVVPFLIDTKRVALTRAYHPEATFVATDDGQLTECVVLEGSGKFGPGSYYPEQEFWRLIRPPQRELPPSSNGTPGEVALCLDAGAAKLQRSDIDHTIYNTVAEIGKRGPMYYAGQTFAGKKAERYDVVVKGAFFFKSSGLDLTKVSVTCLFSPMRELRAVELK